MSNSPAILRTKAGLLLGQEPRVVGVATRLDTVDAFLQREPPPCDVLEFRLDRILNEENTSWQQAAKDVEAKGIPVIATLRLAAEGGAWKEPDKLRWPVIQQACACCSCVDVELQSPLWRQTVEAAQSQNTVVLVSHHDFAHTPSRTDLEKIVEQVDAEAPVIIKVATQVNEASDIHRLRDFLADYEGPHPLCLIGMGELGIKTRLEFPRVGSCLAYGHLDDSTAPGQLSCQELAAQLRMG